MMTADILLNLRFLRVASLKRQVFWDDTSTDKVTYIPKGSWAFVFRVKQSMQSGELRPKPEGTMLLQIISNCLPDDIV
jgi:hypothetical protein